MIELPSALREEEILHTSNSNFDPFVLDCRSAGEKQQMQMLGGETFKRDFEVWQERPENVVWYLNQHTENNTEKAGVPVFCHPFFFDDNDKILVISR